MNDKNKIITKILEKNSYPDLKKAIITEEQVYKDYDYFMAQKITKVMFDKGIISIDEFNKISEKNRETFSPYLVEIMQ